MMKKTFRNKVANFLFLREFKQSHQTHQLITFDKAKTIGILYDSTNEKHFELVKKYVKDIRESHGKDVLALGYFDQKELPPMRFSKLGLDFFTKKDLNWHFKPMAAVVKNFVTREFDILIDLNTGHSIPFRYVVAMSRAKFKIGKYEKAALKFYDFMISTSENITLPQFIDQVNHYLKQFEYEPTA
jgi:hypothetical protein